MRHTRRLRGLRTPDLLVDALVATFFTPFAMRQLSHRHWIARSLARALLADAQKPGGTSQAALQARAAAALGDKPAWLAGVIAPLASLSAITWQKMDLDALTQRIMTPTATPHSGADPEDEDALDVLDETLPEHPFDLAFADGSQPQIRRLILRPPLMRPRPLGLDGCALPDLPTVCELAQWLGIPLDRLMFLSPETPLGAEHYRYQLQPKRSGGLRLLEIPKVDLKRVQRRIHSGLLQQVPVHEAAHGFVQNRSVASHAAAHAGQAVVIRFDVRDFFGSLHAGGRAPA